MKGQMIRFEVSNYMHCQHFNDFGSGEYSLINYSVYLIHYFIFVFFLLVLINISTINQFHLLKFVGLASTSSNKVWCWSHKSLCRDWPSPFPDLIISNHGEDIWSHRCSTYLRSKQFYHFLRSLIIVFPLCWY